MSSVLASENVNVVLENGYWPAILEDGTLLYVGNEFVNWDGMGAGTAEICSQDAIPVWRGVAWRVLAGYTEDCRFCAQSFEPELPRGCCTHCGAPPVNWDVTKALL